MNALETLEIREMTAVELDEVSGGNPALGWAGWVIGGCIAKLADEIGFFDAAYQWKDGKWGPVLP